MVLQLLDLAIIIMYMLQDMKEMLGALRAWDYRWSVSSVPTSLAVFWGEEVLRRVAPAARAAAHSAQSGGDRHLPLPVRGLHARGLRPAPAHQGRGRGLRLPPR